MQERRAEERVWPGAVLCVCGIVGVIGRTVAMGSDGATGLGWVTLVASVAMALAGGVMAAGAVRARRRTAEEEPEARRPAGRRTFGR